MILLTLTLALTFWNFSFCWSTNYEFFPMLFDIISIWPRVSSPSCWRPTQRKEFLTRKYWHTPGCKTPRWSEGPMPWWPTCLGQEEVCGGGRCGLQNMSRRFGFYCSRWKKMPCNILREKHQFVLHFPWVCPDDKGWLQNERRLQGRKADWHQPLRWQQDGCGCDELQEAEGGEDSWLQRTHDLTLSSQGWGQKKKKKFRCKS